MRKLLSFFLTLVLILTVPVTAFAAVYKNGKAASSVSSKAGTANSITIKNDGTSKRLFSAMTESLGSTETSAFLDGDEPADFSATSVGAGASSAYGRNTGKTKGKWLPVIKGRSDSAIAVESISQVSLD